MSFTSHRLEKFSSNPGKDAPLSDMLRQVSINNENKLIALSDSSWKYWLDAGIHTGEYNIFYQGCKIDHGTHVTVPVSQSRSESEYNAACTAGMDLETFRILKNEMTKKDTDVVP